MHCGHHGPALESLDDDLLIVMDGTERFRTRLKLAPTGVYQKEIHTLFVSCQIQLALEMMKAAEYAQAIDYLAGSKQYPERLGTGMPYDPDLRMQDYLQALCYNKLNHIDKAQAARKAIYEYTLDHLDDRSPNQYVGALVLEHFGDHDKAEKIKDKGKPSQQILDVIQRVEESEKSP